MPFWRSAVAGAFLLGCMAISGAANADCQNLLPPKEPSQEPSRAVTPLDLAQLRDIGNSQSSQGRSPLTLSPDGTQVAFVLRQGSPEDNKVCQGVVVVSLTTGDARLVDTGGDLMLNQDNLRGFIAPAGEPAVVKPVWSPDGQWIAYLRSDHGVTQAWRARISGSRGEAVTHLPTSAEGVSWSSDGQRLLVAWRPGLAAAQALIDREADAGWLYDKRVLPNYTARPLLPSDTLREILAITLKDGQQGAATVADQQTAKVAESQDDASRREVFGPHGERAWIEPDGSTLLAPSILRVLEAGGKSIPCKWEACSGTILGIWWKDQARSLIFLRKEGWNNGSMVLYRWWIGDKAGPRQVLSTDGLLSGCITASAGLICDVEETRVPRYVARVDVKTGAVAPIFVPNPEWSHFILGRVQRLTWKNAIGLPAWGDLVLPSGYTPGQRLPLVITQYYSRGFLRGGTGDAYPIFPLAARGFAVLSLDRPTFYATGIGHPTSWDQLNAANQKDWAERKNLLSSLDVAIDKVVAMGVVDPARIGITGLSDGATTVRFALINHPRFAAAAISTCCVEPRTAMTTGGIAWADSLHDTFGYPRATEERPDFWKPVSLALNADHIDTPLLMQVSDKEFQLSLEAFTALREKGKPVELYVYPDEYHEKVGPAHRLSSYIRDIDWFSFWLQGQEDPAPGKRAQYERWEKMKAIKEVGRRDGLTSGIAPMPLRQPIP